MERFEIVKAPQQRVSRMAQPSQIFLKALLGLEDGLSIRLKCADRNEALRTSKALGRFIYDARSSGKLSINFSVLRRKTENNKGGIDWYVFVARRKDGKV